MANRSDEVFLLEDENLHPLPERSMRAGLFGAKLEDALQELLERYPNIIPGRQIDPVSEDPPRFALLRREMPVGEWSLDHLFIDQKGVLTLVEAKLIQNPESRRAVVGQIVEYAANASEYWASGRARQSAAEFWSKRSRELDQVLREQLGEDIDVEELWDRVEANLRKGRLRLLIAADELRPEVRRMTSSSPAGQGTPVMGCAATRRSAWSPSRRMAPSTPTRGRSTSQAVHPKEIALSTS